MMLRLICTLWGHKVMLKVFTGNIIRLTHPGFLYKSDVSTYKWERQKYCLRCGKEVTP